MIINGREIGFRRTVGASCKIAKRCPNGDIARLGEIMTGDFADSMENMAILAAALSEGYENAKKFSDPSYVPNPLTVDEIMLLDIDEFSALISAATDAFQADSETTVDAVPEKKTRAGKSH